MIHKLLDIVVVALAMPILLLIFTAGCVEIVYDKIFGDDKE